MKSQAIPHSTLQGSRLIFGCMTTGGHWRPGSLTDEVRAKALDVFQLALELGFNFFDHADIYTAGNSEIVFSQLWNHGVKREDVIVQSKCGIRFPDLPAVPHRYDFSYEHIVHSVEGSLQRLETDYLDILLLHRPDPLCEPEEVARAFDDLHSAGKVRLFGVSNHTPAQLSLLRSVVRQPLVANQIELSLIHTQPIDAGIVMTNDDPAPMQRGEGVLEYCREHAIAIQAWSPLCKGLLSGRQLEPGDTRLRGLRTVVEDIAREHGAPAEAIILAWLLRHPGKVQPVVGTTDLDRIRNCAQADGVQLSREQWYRLYLAARGKKLP